MSLFRLLSTEWMLLCQKSKTDIDQLDTELASMACIRALGDEYSSFIVHRGSKQGSGQSQG